MNRCSSYNPHALEFRQVAVHHVSPESKQIPVQLGKATVKLESYDPFWLPQLLPADIQAHN